MAALAPVVLGRDSRQTGAFQLNSAVVDGDVLATEVSYAGGCRNHEFFLRAARSFQEVSDSVRLEVAVIHNANEDPCEAFLTEQAPLRPASDQAPLPADVPPRHRHRVPPSRRPLGAPRLPFLIHDGELSIGSPHGRLSAEG